MKVLLMVWLLGQVGPTMPVAIYEYKTLDACQSVLNDWQHFSEKHKGMCLKVARDD